MCTPSSLPGNHTTFLITVLTQRINVTCTHIHALCLVHLSSLQHSYTIYQYHLTAKTA